MTILLWHVLRLFPCKENTFNVYKSHVLLPTLTIHTAMLATHPPVKAFATDGLNDGASCSMEQ